MASKGGDSRSGLVAEAMSKNGRGKARVNVPEEYTKAEWSVEDPPSASALKLLLLVIAACGDDLDGEKQFPMSVLREVPGLAHKEAPFLEAELRQLMKATVRTSARLNFLMGNYERTSFGVIISDAALLRSGKDGPLEGFALRFGETFKQMVRFGEHYAVLDSAAVLAMRSRHSVLLYQYLSFALRAQRIRSLELPLEDVRRVFGLLRDEYPMFGRLKEKVLLPACAEISELTQFKVTATPMLQGRKAVGVRFQWEQKPTASDPAPDKGGPPPGDASASADPAMGAAVRARPAQGRKAPQAGGARGVSPAPSPAELLRRLADRLNNPAALVLPSEVSTGKAAALLDAGLVSRDVLRRRSIAH